MKKKIAIVVAVVVAGLILVRGGCGTWEGTQDAGGVDQKNRTVECSLCDGDGICYHCAGDGFRDGHRCSVCDGTGKCSACDGAGLFDVIEMNGKDYRLCGSCHGNGMCGVCQGTGRYEQWLPTLGQIGGDCQACNGSGRCLSCKGEGWVEVKGF